MEKTPKHRQIRGRITGGLSDVEAFRAQTLRNVDHDQWDLTWDEVDAFGDHGPLRKWTFGFTTKP